MRTRGKRSTSSASVTAEGSAAISAPLECACGPAYARAMSLSWKVGEATISVVTETELAFSCERFLRQPPNALDPYRDWLTPYLKIGRASCREREWISVVAVE